MSRDQRKPYAVELIENTLGNERNLPSSGRAQGMARATLPYCMEKMTDGCYWPLNRDYKPLGLSGRRWAEYEDPRYAALCLPEDDIDLSVLDGGHFFNDANSPLCMPTTNDRNVYLFKLYWVFRHVGMVWPSIPYSSLNTVSKLTGVSVDAILDAMQYSKGASK